VKRLIRLPGSLHGKTGFRVTDVTLDNLKDFDPLIDTIVFSDDPVSIHLEKPIKITINNQSFDLSNGEQKVPLYLAIYLIGSRKALIS